MPLKIVRQDITKIKCDAIVNPTNCRLMPNGGADAAIHNIAGEELSELCKSLGGVAVGEAKITPAFNLPCKYVIHTVGPKWCGGDKGEEDLLRSCYLESLKLALEYGCKSVAFPLISAGLYAYPKDRVLKEAAKVISEFLEEYELDVYIVVYDKDSYSISLELFKDVQAFIDNFYVEEKLCTRAGRREGAGRKKTRSIFISNSVEEASDKNIALCDSFSLKGLDGMLENLDKGFADTLFDLIDKRKITDVEAYKRSNVDKKTFSKIKCNKDYRPGKITAVSFAIGLRLNFEETQHLLSTVGMCLSRSNKFDVIIEYFIRSGNYKTIFDVNEVLYKFDQSLLGV